MSKKVQATLTDEAFAILDASTTERKRGEYISALIVADAALSVDTPEDRKCGALKQVAARLGAVEKQLKIIATRVRLPVAGVAMWNSERIIQAIGELIESYHQSIKAIETAQRVGQPATVFGGELQAIVAVCSALERLISQANGKEPDNLGDWLASLREVNNP